MNRRTCPDCGGRSYFSGSGVFWECPYCGKSLSNVPNEIKPWRYSTSQSKLEKTQVPLVQKASIWPVGFLALFFCLGITLANFTIVPGTYSLLSSQISTSMQFQAAGTFPEATAEEASEALGTDKSLTAGSGNTKGNGDSQAVVNETGSGTDESSPAESGDAEGTGDSQAVKSETGSETEVSAPAAPGDAGENGDSQEVVDEASSGTDESAPVASGNAE